MTDRIVRNAARCRKCEDVIESTRRQHFIVCKCGAIWVDGGHDHLRRGGNEKDFESLAVMRSE